jgi:hypothetical protein
MNPLPLCEKFIRDTLKNDSGVSALVSSRIYSGRPPQKTGGFPCIVFSLLTGAGESAFGPNDERMLEKPVYTVKAVTEGEDYGTAHAIAQAFDTALRSARGPVTHNSLTAYIQGAKKQEWLEYQEDSPEGVRFNYVGANYRLFLSGGL